MTSFITCNYVCRNVLNKVPRALIFCSLLLHKFCNFWSIVNIMLWYVMNTLLFLIFFVTYTTLQTMLARVKLTEGNMTKLNNNSFAL